MSFVLTSEQESIQQIARRFAKERAPVAHLRHLRDTRDPLGFSRPLWKEMAELGFAGLTLPAELGGAGLGHTERALVLGGPGRSLVPSPLFATLLLGAGALALGGTPAQRSEHLPTVATGDRL